MVSQGKTEQSKMLKKAMKIKYVAECAKITTKSNLRDYAALRMT